MKWLRMEEKIRPCLVSREKRAHPMHEEWLGMEQAHLHLLLLKDFGPGSEGP